MKNTNKKTGSYAPAKLQAVSRKLTAIIALAVIIGFGVTGCGDSDGAPSNGGKTALAAPTGLDVLATDTTLTLVWNEVEGADSYTLDIGGVLHQVSGFTNSYDLKPLTLDPKVYNIRVRAVAYNGDPAHYDSAYSSAKSVEVAEYIFEFENDDSAPPVAPNINSRNGAQSTGGKAIKELKPYGKTLERVVVPSQFNGVNVTAIAPNAFADGENIMSSISLPNTIITIGAGAFSGTDIKDIVIPDSVQTIGSGAFANCIVLVVVVFVAVEPPAMEADVFEGSTNIETIVVPEDSGNAFNDIAEKVNAEVQKVQENTKLLLAIEVVEPPKTNYTAGEFFSRNGMTVIAKYSDNTSSVIQNYSVLLRTTSGNTGTGNTSGEFEQTERALTINDTIVRLSYTEGSVTRTVNISIVVTLEPEYIIHVNQAVGGSIHANQTGTVKAGTTVTFYVTVNQGYTLSNVRVVNNNTNQQINHQAVTSGGGTSGNAGNSYTFVMPSSDVTISSTFTANPVSGPDPAVNGTWIGKGYGSSTTVDMKPCSVHQQSGYTHGCPDCKITEEHSDYEFEIELTLNNGNFEWGNDGFPFIKGTYTTSGNIMVIATNQYYTNEFGSVAGGNNAGRWYTRNELKNAYLATGIPEAEAEENVSSIFAAQSGTYTVNATTLALTMNGETITFTKKSTTQPGQTYTVTFYAEGGTFPSGVANVSNNGGTLSVQVQAGGVVPTSQVPSPSRLSSSGYTFNGWYTIVKTGTTETEVPFTLGNTAVYENLTVYAKWSGGSTGGGTGISYSLVANGSSTQTTTQVTISFSGDVPNLTANDITLTFSVSGVVVLVSQATNDGNDKYFLPIYGFTQSGTLSVAIQKAGVNIIGSPRTVEIFYAGTGGGTGGTYTITTNVTGDPAANGSIVTSQQAAAGTLVTVRVSFANGATLANEGLIIKDENGSSINSEFDSNANGWFFTFTMPSSNVTITGDFFIK